MKTTYKQKLTHEGAPIDIGQHQRLVGKLIYLSHTQPHVSFSVSVVGQFMSKPQK